MAKSLYYTTFSAINAFLPAAKPSSFGDVVETTSSHVSGFSLVNKVVSGLKGGAA